MSLSAVKTEPAWTTQTLTGKVLNVAHRGASSVAPENTFPAWDIALRRGADYIELDLQMTKDGVLVVLHDSTLDRTAMGGRGRVADKTLDELETYDVGSWFNAAHPRRARPEYANLRIPTLEQVFRRYGRHTNYCIEIKDPLSNGGIEEELLRLMRRWDLMGPAVKARRIVVQSFFAGALETIHAVEPDLPLIQLFPGMTSDRIRAVLETTASYTTGIGPNHGDVDERLVAEAHDLGLEVYPYTVDARRSIRRLIEVGVDGIITNYPQRLNRLRPPELSEDLLAPNHYFTSP